MRSDYDTLHLDSRALGIWFIGLALAFLFTLPVLAKTPVAVLELQPKAKATEDEANLLTDRIRIMLVNSGEYRVMEREMISRLLKEQGFQSTKVCEGSECGVKIGRLLAVREIITGTVTRLGAVYSLNLRLIDVESGEILKDTVQDCRCSFEKVLATSVPALVSQLANVKLSESEFANPDQSTVRMQRPLLTFIEGGLPLPNPNGIAFGGFDNLRYGSLGALYNINPYVALGGQLGLEGLYTTVNLFGSANARFYTNPHNLAGFLDFGLGLYSISFSPSIMARVGLEYRDDDGFTLGGSGGYTQGLLARDSLLGPFVPGGFTLEFFIGYAF